MLATAHLVLPAWLLVLLAFGATHRLARLITGDFIMQWLRDLAVKRDHRNDPPEPGEVDPFHAQWDYVHEKVGKWEYLTTCDWCVSIWLGAPVAFVATWWGGNRVVVAVLIWLSASAFAGNMRLLEEK